MRTYRIIERRVKVLPDALSVEDMTALGLNGIFGNVVTQSADGSFTQLLRREHTSVSFALENEIRMASHLSHSREPETMSEPGIRLHEL